MESSYSPIPPDMIPSLDWSQMKREFKSWTQKTVSSQDDLIKILTDYTPYYNLFEDTAILKVIPYMNYGGFKNILRILPFVLSPGLPGYRKRNQFIEWITRQPAFQNLPPEYNHLKRLLKKEIDMKPSLLLMGREYFHAMRASNVISGVRAEFQGKTYSLPKLSKFFEVSDRSIREAAWRKFFSASIASAPKLNRILDKLFKIRTMQAKKKGFSNVRDYYHQAKGRFDYTPEDCFKFHDTIEQTVLPLIREINARRKQALGVDTLRPWDRYVSLDSKELHPFSDLNELNTKMVKIFAKIRPQYGDVLSYMAQNHFIDMENRKGKVPGAMCMPLAAHRVGFILGNAKGSHDDVETLAHEGGHSIHFAACVSQPIAFYRDSLMFPMETAEIGSMAMELLSFDHLSEFYSDPLDIQCAKRRTLEEVARLLPWVATVDAFQQWMYTTPSHTAADRNQYFGQLMDRFEVAAGMDYTGLETEKCHRWYRQSHIFQSPFYYIEYGIAQLAALGIYRNYRKNGPKAIEQYHNLLSLGNSRPIPEVFEAGGIKFDFSRGYMQELMDFLKKELE